MATANSPQYDKKGKLLWFYGMDCIKSNCSKEKGHYSRRTEAAEVRQILLPKSLYKYFEHMPKNKNFQVAICIMHFKLEVREDIIYRRIKVSGDLFNHGKPKVPISIKQRALSKESREKIEQIIKSPASKESTPEKDSLMEAIEEYNLSLQAKEKSENVMPITKTDLNDFFNSCGPSFDFTSSDDEDVPLTNAVQHGDNEVQQPEPIAQSSNPVPEVQPLVLNDPIILQLPNVISAPFGILFHYYPLTDSKENIGKY